MILRFQNVHNDKVKQCFTNVMEKYDELHKNEVILYQGPIKSSTMQAQPIISLKGLLGAPKKYRVKLAYTVRDSEHLTVNDLPEEVLTGWFAHELGHVVDYVPYNAMQMVWYGIKYLTSSSFKKEAEHAADRIAIMKGFRKEIIATKRFILDHELLHDNYKEKIARYYMPIEEAEVWDHNHVPGIPKTD